MYLIDRLSDACQIQHSITNHFNHRLDFTLFLQNSSKTNRKHQKELKSSLQIYITTEQLCSASQAVQFLYRGAISIWLRKTPAALKPPNALDKVRNVTAMTPLQPEKPTASRKTAGRNRPMGHKTKISIKLPISCITIELSVTYMYLSPLTLGHHKYSQIVLPQNCDYLSNNFWIFFLTIPRLCLTIVRNKEI